MSNLTCNNTASADDIVSPHHIYQIFGNVAILMFITLPILVLIMALYGFYYRPPANHRLRWRILFLQMAPTVQCLLCTPVLFSPSTLPLVSMFQDLLSVAAMVIFVFFTLHYSGPLNQLESQCPLGTPPCCCLLCCHKPSISDRVAKLITLPFKICPVALVINFLINLYLMYSGIGYPVDVDGFFQASNLHNLLMIPFFISMLYCYKIFVSITSENLKNTNPKLRGSLNLSMFMFCKLSETIIGILEAKSVLPCVQGLHSTKVAGMLLILVQIFYMSTLGIILPRLYAKSWINDKMKSVNATKDGNDKCNGDKIDAEAEEMLNDKERTIKN